MFRYSDPTLFDDYIDYYDMVKHEFSVMLKMYNLLESCTSFSDSPEALKEGTTFYYYYYFLSMLMSMLEDYFEAADSFLNAAPSA